MQRQFVYPAVVERDEAGYFLVTFPDLPEAGTDGETLEEALTEAADCLAEAIAGRVVRLEDIPKASPQRHGQYAVTLPVQLPISKGFARRLLRPLWRGMRPVTDARAWLLYRYTYLLDDLTERIRS